MKKRALVIGSQTGLLLGVDHDAHEVVKLLAEQGFSGADIDLRLGKQATRDGILEGYERLITDSDAGDVAVVYYSGHGALQDIPESVAAEGPLARRRFQAIVPRDYRQSTADSFRGILAEELSVLLHRLTRKTANAAVILDCCHSALMSRDVRLVAKADPNPVLVGVEKCLEDLLAKHPPELLKEALRPQGSDAVRLVACRQEQSAYELTASDGTAYGVFTAGLLAFVRQAKGLPVTWRDIGERAAEHVQARVPSQLPGVEGRADRLLFDLQERAPLDASPVVETLKGWVLRRGRVFGVHVGDVYGIRPPAGLPAANLGTAKVTAVGPTESEVTVTPAQGVLIPEGALGEPVAWAEPPRLVRVPADSEQRNVIVQSFAAERRVTVAPEGDASVPVVATVFARDGKLTLLNADGLPIRHDLPVSAEALADLPVQLRRMAQARALRELEGAGIAGVGPTDLEVEWGLVVDGQPSPLPLAGASVGPGDGVYLRLANRGTRALHAHIFDIGVSDKVTLLTGGLWSMGLRLAPGEEQLLFRHRTTGQLVPSPMSWPETVPKEQGLRTEEILVVATADPVNLTALEQPGVRGFEAPAAVAAKGRTPRLRQLLEQATTGVTREFPAFGDPTEDGLWTKRITLSASPWPVARGSGQFLIDEPRSLMDMTVQPRGLTAPPRKIAVVLEELVVHSNRALGSADIRVDALFVAPGVAPGEAPWLAGTLPFPGVKDGDRLSLDQLVVFMGTVRELVQVCFWVSRDTKGSQTLSEMLQEAAGSGEVQAAMTTLAGLALAAPQAALAVGAATAAVTLGNAAYRLITKAVGKSIGVYRTSLLAADGFRVGRHPAQGLIRAQDFSFGFQVRELP